MRVGLFFYEAAGAEVRQQSFTRLAMGVYESPVAWVDGRMKDGNLK